MLQKLDLRGCEVLEDDLAKLRGIKYLDLRGHAISETTACFLALSTGVSLGVTVQLIFLAALGAPLLNSCWPWQTKSEEAAVRVAKYASRLEALYLDGSWSFSAGEARSARYVASYAVRCPFPFLKHQGPAHGVVAACARTGTSGRAEAFGLPQNS
jgi:hypothetical protein